MPAVPAATATGAANPSPRHRRSRPSVDWRLEHRLFVRAPARPVTSRGVVAALATVALGAVVSLLRQPGQGALDTVWHEDGTIFLADAAGRSLVDALLTPYQGYYHLGPRLLVEIAVLFPAGWAAAAIAALAALASAALGVFVYVAARAHLPQLPLRILVSAPVVVVPLAQDELPNALCNLHWPLLYATVWALLWVPASRAGQVVAFGIVAVTVGSDLLALAYLPLVAARVATQRDRHSALLAGVLVAGLAGQFGGLLLNDNPRHFAPPRLSPAWALASFGLRPVPQVLLGERLFPDDVKSSAGFALAGVAWLIVLALAVLARRRRTRPQPVLTVVLFAQATVLYGEAVMAGGVAVPRYAVAPALMVLAGLAALVPPRPDAPLRWPAAPMWALIGLVGVVCAVNIRVDNPRAQGPSWRNGILGARIECSALDARSTVTVPVSSWVTGVSARLPCAYIRK